MKRAPQAMTIHRAVRAYRKDGAGKHHRYRSWEHCFDYFHRVELAGGLDADRDQAALQLAFYLASWGMYRGSSFLLQHSYTVHRAVVDVIAQPRFHALWHVDFGANGNDARLVPLVLRLVASVRKAYTPFAIANGSRQPTDTLVTKAVLGTLGCLPACDRYFIDGFASRGFQYSRFNDRFVVRVLAFCQEHQAELRREQTRITRTNGIRYPLMKLVDMYFWQLGYEKAAKPADNG